MRPPDTTRPRKAEPKLFNICFPLILAALFLWPSWSTWKHALHLSDAGVWETTAISREYTKKEVQGALQGGKGKTLITEMSVFEYGPIDQRIEGEIPQSRGFHIGEAITIVYAPDDLSTMLVEPVGRSSLQLYLSINGFGLRVFLALIAGLLIALGLYNLCHYILAQSPGRQKVNTLR
jgi:hypothetical protein